MPRKRFINSGYVAMQLVVFFDLPVRTKEDRKNYAKFRKALLEDGFAMLQFSVYARYCPSDEIATRHKRYVRDALPPRGAVRMLTVTTRQFEKMENFIGPRQTTPEREPDAATFY